MLAEMIADFRERMAPHVGRNIGVWTVAFFRPYIGGELLRLSDDGLIVAGYGVVPYDIIDLVGVDGLTVRFAA